MLEFRLEPAFVGVPVSAGGQPPKGETPTWTPTCLRSPLGGGLFFFD
jgi:hypothetical protein